MISNCSFKNLSRFTDTQISQFESMMSKYKVKYVLNNSSEVSRLSDFEELAVDSITSGNILELDIRDTKSTHRYVNYKAYE